MEANGVCLLGEGVTLEVDDAGEGVVEGVFGGVADGVSDAVEGGNAAEHVVEGAAIGLFVGEVLLFG